MNEILTLIALLFSMQYDDYNYFDEVSKLLALH